MVYSCMILPLDVFVLHYAGTDPGFQVRRGGAHLKKSHRAEGGANILGYFVWKITILRQKIIFFPIAEGGAKIVGVFRVKNHDFTQKNHIFSNFKGGARWVRLPWIRPCIVLTFKEIKHLSDYRTIGPSDCRTIGLSDYRSDPGKWYGGEITIKIYMVVFSSKSLT